MYKASIVEVPEEKALLTKLAKALLRYTVNREPIGKRTVVCFYQSDRSSIFLPIESQSAVPQSKALVSLARKASSPKKSTFTNVQICINNNFVIGMITIERIL